jgi:hypothetical protein
VPTSREAGIWAASGVTVGTGGDLFIATGNSASTTSFDYGESVIHLSPTLAVLDYFAPSNWAQLNAGDTDLGSVAPTILPNRNVFEIGKDGIGYLLGESNLGGIGGQLYAANLCAGAYGGTARVGQVILVPCTDGIVNVVAGTSNLTASWRTSSFEAGSPIVTGDVLWAENTSTADLLGFNLTTGQEVFSFPLGSVDHFCTPAAAPGAMFAAGGDRLYGFSLG